MSIGLQNTLIVLAPFIAPVILTVILMLVLGLFLICKDHNLIKPCTDCRYWKTRRN